METIVAASNESPGKEAIFCDGSCSTWLHRRCAGLFQSSFQAVSRSLSSFYCPHCRLDAQENEIISLKLCIQKLTEDIKCLHSMTSDRMSSSSSTMYQNSDSNNVENVPPSQPMQEVTTSSCKKTILNSNSETTVQKRQNNFVPIQEKKFNVLIFGIQECPKGLSPIPFRK